MDTSNQQIPPPIQPQPISSPEIGNTASNPGFKKWFMWSLFAVVFISLLAGGGYYFLSNQKQKTIQYPKSIVEKMNKPTVTPDPTADWRIYANTKYGLSIKYPQNWRVEEQGNRSFFYPPGVTPGMWEKATYQMPGTEPYIEISVINKPYSDSDGQNKEMIKNQFVENVQQIPVDGKQGIFYSLQGCAPLCPTRFDLPYENGSKILQLSLISIGQENVDLFNKENKTNIQDADEGTFKKMISTFKFSEKSQAQDTSNWKTYTFKDIFSFSYPSDWDLRENNENFVGVFDKNYSGAIDKKTASYTSFEITINDVILSQEKNKTNDQLIEEDYRYFEYSTSSGIGDHNPKEIDRKKIKVDGKDGIEYTIQLDLSAPSAYLPYNLVSRVYVISGKKMFKFRLNGSDQDLLKKILSTFKFTQ